MAKAIGKAFKIKPNQVRGYGYAKPGKSMRANPGVTAIAAINGRGSHRRSAKSAMRGLGANARRAHARRVLSSTQRQAFARKLQRARSGSHTPNKKQVERAKQRIRASLARSSKKKATRRKSMRYAGNRQTRKQRAASLKNLRKARAARKHAPNRRRKRGSSRRKHRRNSWGNNAAGHSAAAKKGWASRRARMAPNRRKRRGHKKNRRKAHRRNVWRGDSAGHSAAAKKGWRKRKGLAPNRRRRRKHKANRRRRKSYAANRRRKHTTNRRRHRRNRRRKHKANRRRRKSYAANRRRPRRRKHRANRRRHRSNRRRKHTTNRRRRRSYASNRRRGRRRHKANRRRGHRRNRRRSYRSNRKRTMYRRNGFGENFMIALKAGGAVLLGIIAQKAATKILGDLVLDKMFGAQAAPPTPTAAAKPAEAPAVSGLEALQPYKAPIAAVASALVGVAIANAAIKDVNTKMLISAGICGAALHTIIVSVMAKVSPEVTGYLAGYDDGTAARLSAMYGLGAGYSIMPKYAPISGMGEYYSDVSGLGEYFSEPMSGLGAYGGNPDIYQAAAGYGAVSMPGNHIDPSSDLDRELSIAEAAAGVGAVQPYEASAGVGLGIGEYFSEPMSGLGAVKTLPAADTWIPGMSHPEIWAGVRGVSQPQSSTAMVPAGILETQGGGGVFG